MMSREASTDADEEVVKSFGALRLIAGVLRALAWVELTVGGMGSMVFGISLGIETDSVALGSVGVVGGLLLTFIQAIVLFALADLIIVFLNIEQNTADIADYTELLSEAAETPTTRTRFRRR